MNASHHTTDGFPKLTRVENQPLLEQLPLGLKVSNGRLISKFPGVADDK
jgi:hypothetical protein